MKQVPARRPAPVQDLLDSDYAPVGSWRVEE